MSKPTLIDPLRRRGFRRLALSYAVNELGDWMGIVALSVLVYDRTGSALATAVLFLGTGFVPAVLAPLLVARVERPPPRFVLPVLYAGEAAAFAGLALFASHFSLAAVFVLATLDGAIALAARALTRAVVAAMLEPAGELRSGNAILNVAFTGGAAVGPAIAGLVVAGFGVEAALLLDAVSFYAIAWILFAAGPLPQAVPDPGNMLERLRAGFAYISRHLRLRHLMLAQGAAFVFFAAVIPVEVIYAKETLGVGDSGYGLLLASWGTGMVLGSFVFAALRGASLPYLLFLSTATIGLGYIGMAVAPVLAVACLASIVGGVGNGVQWVAVVSAVQELTSENMQARVMSVLESIGAAMLGVGYLAGGLIAATVDPRATFFFAGLGVLAIVAVFAPILGTKWSDRVVMSNPSWLDGQDDVVLELLPGSIAGTIGGSRSVQSDSEVLP
ncbi:MAG TPA: MFS transporter [Solirubrobacterales bacterium]|nr:MFS transporter [Solirubrobacterales bacterium]